MIRTVIVGSRNIPPEKEVNQKLKKLGEGWRVTSASTVMVPWGEIDLGHPDLPSARHVYFVTTIVVEK